MAATKRNAGLTSAVPRATLNDEELVRTCPLVTVLHHRHSVSLCLINQEKRVYFINKKLAIIALRRRYLSIISKIGVVKLFLLEVFFKI